jgi:hypothetical protein
MSTLDVLLMLELENFAFLELILVEFTRVLLPK